MITKSLVFINIPTQVQKEILEIRKSFNERYSSNNASGAIPKIMLLSFLQTESAKDKIIEIFQKFCNNQPNFNIKLSGYGFFPTHTIYINIPDKKAITNFRQKLFTDIHNKQLVINRSQGFAKNYHINIATNLDTELFYKAQSEYIKKSYEANFEINSITLLDRIHTDNMEIPDSQKSYRFQFGRVRVEQESLFG